MFMCELDRASMDGSLLQCIAGETYSFGVSLRYGYGQAKTGTDFDRQMLEDWMHKQGGISACLTGKKEVACNCTHVSEGAYAFAFSATEIGPYKLWVFVGNNPVPGSPFPVMYHAGPPYPKNCTIIGLGLWSAVVGQEATFTWTARDKYGNPVEFGGHPFTVSMYGPEEIDIRLEDHQDGTYTARYIPTVAGEHRMNVMLDGDGLPGSPFLVKVSEGQGDPAMSTVTGEGLNDCQVGTDRHFLIEAVDKFGNRVLHGGDNFTAELLGPVPEQVHIIDMDDGTYAGTFMCRWSGQFQFNVYLNGVKGAGSPHSFYVRPAPTLAQNCECTLIKLPMSRLVGQAGEACSFTIFAKDRYGNQRDEGGDEFTVRCRGPYDVVQAVITDNKDGTYLAEFTCLRDGDYFIDVKLDNMDIMQSPFVLTVDPAKTKAEECVAEGIDSEFGNGLKESQAGREVMFRIQAMDQFGNRVVKPGDDFQVKITEVAEGIRVKAKVLDNGDGTYDVTWCGMLRGEYDIHVALKEDAIKGSPWKVTVKTGKASAQKSTAEGVGLGGSEAGKANSILIETNDHYGNVVTNGGANLTGQLVSVDGKESVGTEVADHEDGTYTLTYRALVSSEYFLAVRIDGEHIHESPFLLFIDHTDTEAQKCIADGRHSKGDGLKGCRAGEETGFQLFAYDTYNNRCTVGGDHFYSELRGVKNIPVDILDHQDGHYTCTYTPIWAGNYALHVLLNGEDIQGSPWAIFADVAEIDPPSCYIHGAGIYSSIAGIEAEFHVQAKDRFENLRPYEDSIEVLVSGPEKVVIHRRYLGDGQYDFFWTGNVTGMYDVDIVCNGQSLGTAPYAVSVTSGPVFPINCIATGEGLSLGKAGVPNIFVIQSRDKFGNNRTVGGDKYNINVSGPAACEAKMRDLENGRYSCSFMTRTMGTYWVSITLDGEEISGSPYFCEIEPAEVDVSSSTASGMGLLAVGTFRESSFTIHSFDKYGNHLNRGGDNWHVTISGSEFPEIAIVDNQDGTYTVTYQTTVRGTLMVWIGIRGREIPDCPFEVLSDIKVRRKVAQERAAERQAKMEAAQAKKAAYEAQKADRKEKERLAAGEEEPTKKNNKKGGDDGDLDDPSAHGAGRKPPKRGAKLFE